MSTQSLATVTPTVIAAATPPLAERGQCPVPSVADASAAPAPDSQNPPQDDALWYGTAALWSLLPATGQWTDLPLTSDGYAQVVFWRWADLSAQNVDLSDFLVSGFQRDAPHVLLQVQTTATGHHPDLGDFVSTRLLFPTAGCWQIIASRGDARLAFAVWLAP